MDVSKITNTMRKVLPLKACGAVIVAAGTASRMGGIDKVMASVGGEPMIVHTVRACTNHNADDRRVQKSIFIEFLELFQRSVCV